MALIYQLKSLVNVNFPFKISKGGNHNLYLINNLKLSPKCNHFILKKKISSSTLKLNIQSNVENIQKASSIDKNLYTQLSRNDVEDHKNIKFRNMKKTFEDEIVEKISLKKNNRISRKLALILTNDIVSSIHAFNEIGLPNKSFQIFAHYCLKFKKQEINLEDFNKMINICAYGFCLKGELFSINECYQVLNYLKLKPDEEFCSYYFYKAYKDNNLDLIPKFLKHLNNEIDFKKLFYSSLLDFNQQKELIQALEKLGYKYSYQYKSFKKNYNLPIVDNLLEEKSVKFDFLGDNNVIDFEKNLKEQLLIESNKTVFIKSCYKKNKNAKISQKYNQILNDLFKNWETSLKQEIKQRLINLRKQCLHTKEMSIYPFIKIVGIDNIVKIILDSSLELSLGGEQPPCFLIKYRLATKIEEDYLAKVLLKRRSDISNFYKQYTKYYLNPDSNINSRLFYQNFLTNERFNLNIDFRQYKLPKKIFYDVGDFIFNILTTLKIDSNILNEYKKFEKPIPVFALVYKKKISYNYFEELCISTSFLKLIELSDYKNIIFDSNQLPMVVPPVPWISNSIGGYLLKYSDLMRENEHDTILCYEKLKGKNINVIYDALNVISLIPWRINTAVLDVILEVFNNGGNMDVDVPIHSSNMPVVEKISKNLDKNERQKLIYKSMITRKANREMYSLWCTMLYKLSIANYFRDKTFWFPHNLDFRGRAYTTSVLLTHLSSDSTRGLLIFAKGKKLGKNGFDWIKIHLVNLLGNKKLTTNKDRLSYCNEILDKIRDSAEKPLTGNKWWMTTEEPWQVLACCMEINNILKSGNPFEYVSHFPIHQDGSCNGLQHYAALGRDLEGGKSVNLYNLGTPSDVYTEVAQKTELLRLKDAEKGNKLAILLEGCIERKIVKQTIMTYVYGVTKYGATLQILKQLKNQDIIKEEVVNKCSFYLANLAFEALADMFTCTKNIQEWLNLIAMTLCKRLNEPIEWVTPLNLPILQPYIQNKSKNKKIIRINENKQKNSFPPNFIHSLDSSHMMLTALNCNHNGLTFVSIHDSFWTHACDIDQMNVICREQFIKLHSQNILQNLSNHLVSTYHGLLSDQNETVQKEDLFILNLIQQVPKQGVLDLKEVLNSVYFFS